MSQWVNNANKLKQTYFDGFVDISGNHGNLYVRNNGSISLFDSSNLSIPSFSINANKITVVDGLTQYDISNQKIIHIKDLSENVQTRLTDLTSRTQHIMGSIDTSDANTMLTFDEPNNNMIVYSNIIPATVDINLGSVENPFHKLYVNQNTIQFVNPETKHVTAALSVNNSTGTLDISANNSIGTTLVSYGGNVALGKHTTTPNYTLDISGEVHIQGKETSINGVTFSHVGDVNIIGNIYANYPVNTIPQSSIVGGLDIGNLGTLDVTITNHSSYDDDGFLIFNETIQPIEQKVKYNISDLSFNGTSIFQGDVSVNGGLTMGHDNTIGRNLYVKNDTYIGDNIYVNKNATILQTLTVSGSIVSNGDTILNNRLLVMKDVSLNGNVHIGQNVFMNEDLYVQGESLFINNTTFNSDLSVDGNTSIVGNMTIEGQLFANYPNNSIPATAIIGGVGTGGSNALVAVNNTFPESLTYDNDMFTTINHTNAFQNATYDVNVNGNLYAAGHLTIINDATMNQKLFIGGDVSMNGLTYMNRSIKPLITNSSSIFPSILDFHLGNVFYLSNIPNTNFTCYFINIPADLNRTIELTLYIDSANYSTFCNSISINSTPQTLVYLGGFSNIQVSGASMIRQTFTILNTSSQSLGKILTQVDAFK